jgi:pSer/pThr/pTyr-binding forkhead associated (FHA) protein
MADLILEIVEGRDAGRQLQLDRPLDIGRDQSMPVALTDDTQASRRHARVTPQNGGAVVEDLGSTNGTYLGQRKLDGPVPMEIGAPLRIGKTVLELR